MDLRDWISAELQKLKAKGLYRDLNMISEVNQGRGFVDFSSNDYLGFASKSLDLLVKQGLVMSPIASTGSRLTSGSHLVHRELEEYISRWKGVDDSMVFSSGYMANLGALSALLNPRDLVLSDELNHSSLLDGIRLSRAKKFVYRHNDIVHLEALIAKHRHKYAKAFIVTDTVFSMDGDRANLTELIALANKYSASLYLDEAHATGLLGTRGEGLLKEDLLNNPKLNQMNLPEIIQMSTFSKAIGVEGACVSASKNLIEYLRNKARTFVYSTAPSPLLMSMVLANLLELEKNPEPIHRLRSNIDFLREQLMSGFPDLSWTNDKTAIFVFHLGRLVDSESLRKVQEAFGIKLSYIRPPSAKTPRLRLCLKATHSQEDILKFLRFLDSPSFKEGILNSK